MDHPILSVLMPVYNGALTLERAVQSVIAQTFRNWELLAVDDCSADASHALLLHWSRRDERIEVFRTSANQGPAAARNLGLSEARGEFIAYLDCDDEFYPDYLQQVARFRSEGDVLLFQFDWEMVDEKQGARIFTWDPAAHRDSVFMENPAGILGVAHRRDLLDAAGPFDERPWFQEDWDLWKRLARTGATFLYLPFKSGIYHSVPTSLTHSPRMTEKQRAEFERNYQRRQSAYAPAPARAARRAVQRIVFASPHCLIDPSSGAAEATWRMLELLSRYGFACEAFGSVRMDFDEEVCVEQVLAELGLPYDVRNVTVGGYDARMLFTRKGNVPVTLFRNRFSRCGPTPEELPAYAAAWEQFLHRNRPDVVVTYGGDPLAMLTIDLAKRRDIPVVFALHNFAYATPEPFMKVDYVVVPSDFSRRWYWERLGLVCQVLPNVIDPRRVCVDKQGGVGGEQGGRPSQYVTFVNPQATKGLFVFARIAEQIARRRPDIPILVIDSRGRGKALEQTGVDLSWARSLFSMANTPDPRKFYAVTKALVTPSLWNESFGLVAAEAMINGIPVLASNRGALPETVGEGGLVLDIPARYTPSTRDVPTAEEVEPWVEAIMRLWDDADCYARQSAAARAWSARWRPEALRPLYESFFRNVHPQPGPPLALRSAGAP